MKTQFLSLTLAGMMALSAANSWADSSSTSAVPAPTVGGGMTSTTNTTYDKIKKNIRLNYQNWFRGPNIRALSGNTDGSGMNLLMTHYLSAGYKIGSRWSVSATQPFTQYIDNVSAKEKDPFVSGDPYLTFTNARVLSSDRYGANLYAYLRYYAPVSRKTNQLKNAADPDEAGNGQVRLYVAPSKTYFDGALTINVQTLFQYRFAKNNSAQRAALNKGDPLRNDYIFIFDPVVSYATNANTEWYLEYAFDMTHSNNGHWTKWKADDYFSPGVNLMLTKKFLFNPYLEFDPRAKEVKNTRVGTNIVYYFL